MDGEENKDAAPVVATDEAPPADPAPVDAPADAPADVPADETAPAEGEAAPEEAPATAADETPKDADAPAEDEEHVEEIDYASDERIKIMISHLTECLENFNFEEQWKVDHYQWMHTFLNDKDKRCLFFWNDFDDMALRASDVAAPKFYDQGINPQDYQVCFFIKKHWEIPLTPQNLKECVHFRQIGSDPLDDLLEKMNQEYTKKLLQENDWPDGVKKEFIMNLHKFMAFLNETTHAARGQTFLYIPDEDLSDLEAAAKDKDLLQRLESTMIHWTQQIKELVSNQDSPTNNQIESPLDEIAYWNKRTANLVVLTKRLQLSELKKIVKVLENAGSSYLPGFIDLEKKIQAGFDEAQDNLQFLNTLSEPCRKIEQSKPKDIPKILPEALNCVRIIWELSKYYNTSERMKGLLTKISNQIIKRCRARIDKNDMLDGDVEKCMSDLQESIDCCKEWKNICIHSQKMLKKYTSKPGWDLDQDDTIFAENEAFIQRCKDLMEICEGQLQFARKGENLMMPVFGGVQGPQYTENLLELQRQFVKHLQNIKNLNYDILDVKITKWHDDYGQFFKEQCKSLEIMYQNIIALAFKNVSSVSDAVEMLENFDSLAKRPLVIDYVHKKASDMVFKMFLAEIKEIEDTFEANPKRPPPMPFSHPKYAGLAIWTYSLIVRLDKAKTAVERLYFIPENQTAKDAYEKYDKLKQQLDSSIEKTFFKNWKTENAIDAMDSGQIDQKLEVSVLVRSENNQQELPASITQNPLFSRAKKNGLLESNFDCDLHKVLIETSYWIKIQTLGFVNIPNHVLKLLQRKDQLRILRENIMLIVRDYNNIIHTIDDKERSLFKEHLDILDRCIEPGIKRHNWGSQADSFVYACRKECQDVFLNVKKFQNNIQKINMEFEKISTTTLTNIQKKLYILNDFVRQQEDTLKVREQTFIGSFDKIAKKMMKVYDLFMHRSTKIQGEWLKFVVSLDSSLERSLKQSVKNTLLDLGKHIIGDKQRQELVPIFRVYNILDTDPSKPKWDIKHEPTHDDLKTNINIFIHKIINVTKVIPRIEKIFRERRSEKIDIVKKELDEAEKSGGNMTTAFAKAGMRPDVNYQNLTDEEKLAQWKARWELPRAMDEKDDYEGRISRNGKIRVKTKEIIAGIDAIQSSMGEDQKIWVNSDEIRQLNNMKSDKGIRRILRGSNQEDSVQKYKESIEILIDLMNDIKNRQQQKHEQFIIFDYSKLKNTLIEYGNECIQTIFQHLIKESKDDLNNLLNEFEDTITILKTPPTQLAMLKKNKDLFKATKEKLAILDAKRDPIKRKFIYIQEQDTDLGANELSEEDKQKLEGLDDAWQKFQDGLEEANTIINKCYQSLKTEVENTIEDFKKECIDNKNSFIQNAPKVWDKNMDNAKAFEKLNEYTVSTAELRAHEEQMQAGLEIFDFEPIAYPEVALVEKEIQQLTQLWDLKNNWDKQYDSWKDIGFFNLDIDEMETVALDDYLDKFAKFDKEMRDWGIYSHIRNEIQKFRDTMPLLSDLRAEAMRERHWKELRIEVKEDFDEQSEEFNLDKVMSLNLLSHIEKIGELADNAKKQLKIEVELEQIRFCWEDSEKSDLIIEKQKSKADNEEFYQIKSTENIMELIEDHGGKLGNHKSSPYYKEFDTLIDHWEANISQITETLEVLLAVQGKWKYLESIFRGQPDISKQLPNEDAIFKKNNTTFKAEMERIAKTKNCLNSLIVKNFLPLLNDLNKKFEQIQKNLNQFLEAKRGQFPRFYFLSNEDLLEIIGQSKDPKPILQHIGKMFEGIASLTIQTQGSKNNLTYEITELQSNDKPYEAIPLRQFAVDPKVEAWLKKLVNEMKASLRRLFYQYYHENSGSSKNRNEKEKMMAIIKQYPGQILITMCQLQWTTEVNGALVVLESSGQQNQLRKVKSNYKKKVENYVELVEKPGLEKLQRIKIVSLIIIDQHNSELIDQLYQKKISTPKAFDWLSQLRFRRANDESDQLQILVDQTNCTFEYGNEYQGNNGRLVVTPLTDRAYMTLTNALNMQRGGAPQGPAGTGKTETVKDLGKGLAFFVVIMNCSDQMDVVSLGKMFAGLALSGAWGCFDEFNRILLDVLSVVASQVQTILDAIRKKEQSTPFGEITINVQKETGLFITMNPGYAGRSELPDNLASLFRPVAMMAPDFVAICKISLMSEGFKQNDVLSKKVTTIYELMKKQLSKQTHYDFGMRAIKSVLNASGRIKRENPDLDEISVMIKSIRDMNLPKFIAEDVVLFDNLFIDLFPDCEEPPNDNDALQIEIEDAMLAKGLQLNENLVVKIMQLYESKVTRHGNMLVGATLSGKTTAWKILIDALNRLSEDERKNNKTIKPEDQKFMKVVHHLINPKSITIDELYGNNDDQNPPQWQDGILSSVLKQMCNVKTEQQWMILDGPVDTLWIESMNSVLDDSKLLTLNNGDRIALTNNVRLLFEVEDLGKASPATVSRAGMIFMDLEELGWNPYMTMWINQKPGEEFREHLNMLVDKYIHKVLKVKKTQCKELVKSSESACVINLCKLFDALCTNLKQAEDQNSEDYKLYVEKWFVFCLIWSIGATVEDSSRKNIDYILRDIESMFPHSNTVYEHYINTEKKEWAAWEEKLSTSYKPVGKEFHEINVPTVDTVRNRYIVQNLLDNNIQVLLVGHSGVGKTVLIDGILMTLDANTNSFTINFSAGTTSSNTQSIIENNFERKAKNKYKPKNAKKKCVCFIDDLNMPRQDTFGSQPPLELLRQWMDYEFWYDRQKIVPNYVQDFQLLSAMGKPGGGRAEISNRITSKFHLINYTTPSETNMKKIYETIGAFKFQTFDEEIKNLSEPLAIATINVFNIVQDQFLPTPAKSHYVFNMRDVSKVFQGLYQADKNFYEGKEHIVKLWAHEVCRVFQDRLNSYDDREKFKGYVNEQLEAAFQMNYAEHCTTNGEDPIFVDFMGDYETQAIYEECTNFPKLREYLNEKLVAYNAQPKISKMNIVLFKDAITHIAKIYRVINLKRGHAFLVGVGGSGRHSLTRMSAFLSKMNVYQLEVFKGFNLKNFREFLKVMYEQAAYKGKDKLKTVFIFSDNDVVQESFLEDIQNMLNGGVVPNIYAADEMNQIREGIRKKFKKDMPAGTVETPEALSDFFFNGVKDNLHMSICMSPIGQAFRDYTRMYPALINNTTIDWFMGWPEDALTEVAMKFIGEMGLEEEMHAGLSIVCSYAHQTTTDTALLMQQQLKRIFYVTPTNFVELLKGYGQIIKEKRTIVDNQRTKLRNGLSKLDDARKQVEVMSAESEIKRIEVSKQSKECDDLMQNIARERKLADEKQVFIEAEQVKIEKEKAETEELADEADRELKKAEPALLEAQKALEGLDKKYIAEIKSFASPPPAVETVMSAVMTVLQKEQNWASVKKELADSNFVKKVMEFDIDNIPAAILKKVEKYTKMESFQPLIVGKVSTAAACLCQWVRSIEDYSKALKIVAPKRAKKEYALEQLRKKMEYLKTLEDDFAKLAAMLADLEVQYNSTTSLMKKLKDELDNLQVKIDRGDKLVSGLAGEKTRWEASLIILDEDFAQLVGNCVLAAAFMSYCGPFPSDYRDTLIQSWIDVVESNNIPFTKGFDFANFMAGPAQAREWQQNGLPTDKFSTENGVFVTKGLRWALNIDPQTQAMNWIKKTCGDQIVIADYKDTAFAKKLEQGIIHGKQVLFLDVGQEMDPTLDNVLNKNLIQVGRNFSVRIGDKEVEYNTKFKLYITTRMSNPHYTPEVSTKVAVVNFTVKESGLIEQCLGIVVKAEQANLEQTKNEVITRIASNKATILQLEDTILKMLSESKTNILEDVALIDTLQLSKEKSDEIKNSLEASEIMMKKIDDTREIYRECGKQASILFFVLNDLNKIDPMYQFSLDWYKALFVKNIEESKEHMLGGERIHQIIKYHQLKVYQQACRSLFEKHKLLLSMQICIRLQMAKNEVNEDEWNFFLRGGQVLDRSTQAPKPPFSWITQQIWDNVTELEKCLPETFTGLPNAIQINQKEWLRWYLSVNPSPPELAQLPGEWETKCDDKLKKMIVLRCFRVDRVNFAIRNYVEAVMKKDFVDNRPTIMKDVFDDSRPEEPIIFVLSKGVDPTEVISKEADARNVQFESISMGKGQSEKAKRILSEGAAEGQWVFLANTHLSISLLPELENIIEGIFKQKVSEDFRLLLSAAPHPDFSISLLQKSMKITQEPPKGIKSGMLKVYGAKQEFTVVDQSRAFRKALFGLAWFHTILIERKKFKSLGWNVTYAFNDSDYNVCEDLLANYMGRSEDGKPVDEFYQKGQPIAWSALQYLIASCNYGGRVTDDRDRRLLEVYAKEIFNDNLILPERWKPYGTDELNYQYPFDEAANKTMAPDDFYIPKLFYDEIAAKMEDVDKPIAYGQHVNAEINSQVIESSELLDSILGLTPQKVSGGGDSQESGTLKILEDIEQRLPEFIDLYALKAKLRGDDNPLNVVLVQEIQRYNILLRVLAKHLDQLQKGLKGLVVISPDLESILISVEANRVPVAWGFAYFSLKPLANWYGDLIERYEFFREWATKGTRYHFWIGAFTYPTGFTTSLLQRFSRKASGAPIDKLEFDFLPVPKEPQEINEHPKDGAFISGLFLEGAQWDNEKLCLTEPGVMELTCPMPILHFKPIQKRSKPPQNIYECPCYYYPNRAGDVTKDSWMLRIDLKSGDYPAEFWIKRGTAILMSVAN